MEQKYVILLAIKQQSPLPVICVGNIVVGGAGKTPVSLKIGKLLIKAGYKPNFISKGYAGLISKSTLVRSWHSATSVGDESILLSEVAPTWIGTNRINSSILAKKEGADCLIMDDGFQNPTIQKDFSIIVINAVQEFGNKRVMPSGPLRESVHRGLSRTNLIIVVGEISNELKQTIPENIPIIEAKFEIKKKIKILKVKILLHLLVSPILKNFLNH